MALRPSHRPPRDRGLYITLKWHRLGRPGAAFNRTKRVPWATVTLCCPHVALVCKEKTATLWGRVWGQTFYTNSAEEMNARLFL